MQTASTDAGKALVGENEIAHSSHYASFDACNARNRRSARCCKARTVTGYHECRFHMCTEPHSVRASMLNQEGRP